MFSVSRSCSAVVDGLDPVLLFTGKIVHIIRKINQKPPATFKDKETIKIPQFYVSGYITITIKSNTGFKST